jgi:hypothetical protein
LTRATQKSVVAGSRARDRVQTDDADDDQADEPRPH